MHPPQKRPVAMPVTVIVVYASEISADDNPASRKIASMWKFKPPQAISMPFHPGSRQSVS